MHRYMLLSGSLCLTMGILCMSLGTLVVFANKTTHLCTKRLCFWSTGDFARFLECLCKAAHSSLSTSTLRFTTFDNALFSAPEQAYAWRVLQVYAASWELQGATVALPFGLMTPAGGSMYVSFPGGLMLLECSMSAESRTSTGSNKGRSVSSKVSR